MHKPDLKHTEVEYCKKESTYVGEDKGKICVASTVTMSFT